MGGVTTLTVERPGKTEKRVAAVLGVLVGLASWTYQEVQVATGGKLKATGVVKGGVSYDILLYIFSTLEAVGLVRRTSEPNPSGGPGAPRARFEWTEGSQAQVMGTWAA